MQLLFLLSFCIATCHSYRILLHCPTLSNSHVVMMGRLADTLIHAGHEVTLFLPELDPRANKTGSKLATEIRVPGKNPEGFLKAFTQKSPFEEQELMSVSAFKSMFQFMDLMEAECEHLVTSAPVMDRLRQSKFDLIIIEMYDYCGFGIAHLLGIPSRIWMSSMPLTEQMSAALGVPWPTSYIPGIFTAMSDRMSYSERFKNFIGVNLVVQLTLRTVVSQEQSVFDRNFGADFPRLWDLAGTTPVVFVNSEELLDFPRPILHKTIYMGGLGMEAPKKLDKNFEAILNGSTEGVVLMSFGSIARSVDMPADMKKGILETFARFPAYTFLWKYEEEDMEMVKGYKNVKLVKWAPQVDLLGHPKLKAFITHAGYNSMMEAALAGKPMITVPLFADQFRNSQASKRQGISLEVDKTKIGRDESLYEALNDILSNPEYSQNAARLSNMIKKKPHKPEELVVRWVEFAAEFKQLPNLQPTARDLNVFQYYCIDIIAPLIFGFILVLYISYRILKFSLCFLIRIVKGPKKSKKD